jgi:hypothetical protein
VLESGKTVAQSVAKLLSQVDNAIADLADPTNKARLEGCRKGLFNTNQMLSSCVESLSNGVLLPGI